MTARTRLLSLLAAAALALPAAAQAQYTFVGSWSVADGPGWWTNPQVMSGRQTAAFLFGGNATDYAISTVGSSTATINFKTFLDGWGDMQYLFNPADQDFAATTRADNGYDCGGTGCSYSAYVSDHSGPGQYVNYAFRIDQSVPVSTTPEPASLALMGTGLLALAGVIHRRRKSIGG